MSVVLGVVADGSAFRVDLVADGPHMLVAGTTGSGKSELLQTLVAGLAATNRPDELSFVLIDYKGGSAFKDCARLPHTVGTVTDLDGHLPERALTSLTAELRRRETVLRDAGCKDIDDYRSCAPHDARDLPRLVLVVDEYATLAEELPDFLTGLVGIAQRGRSLGIHLILATQRPGGAVSADIRANTAIRVALRVTDAAESVDVVDSPVAAFITPAAPGRAVVRLAGGDTTTFQTARVGGCARVEPWPIRVQPQPWLDVGDPPPVPSVVDEGVPTDLTEIVDGLCRAAAATGVRVNQRPWRPPLERVVTLEALPAVTEAAVPLGLLDLPAEQRCATLTFDLGSGEHLLVAGTARSGRTTVLRTLAGSAAARFAVDDLHIYAFDGAGGLSGLAALPHCGAVVGRDEPARAARLLARVTEEVHRRQALLSVSGFTSVSEQRAAAAPAERLPWLLLMVDGWDIVQAAYDEIDHGRLLDALQQLVQEGPAVGLQAVIAGDRTVLTSRVASAISDRLLLRLADSADYALAGLNPRQVPAVMPPGRALDARGNEAQVALLEPDDSGRAQNHALRAVALAAQEGRLHRPIVVSPLPQVVSRAQVEAGAPPNGGRLWTLIGLGGDAACAQGVDLGADGPAFVIAGPPRSGRSTTLLSMTDFLLDRDVDVVLVAPARSPLWRRAGSTGVLHCVRPHDLSALAAATDVTRRPLVILVDDVELLHDTGAERALLGLLDAAQLDGSSDLAIVVAGSAAAMGSQFRGLSVEARRHGCGLLLGPVGPLEAELLGVRAPPRAPAPPGRGLLVVRGHATPVQVAAAG